MVAFDAEAIANLRSRPGSDKIPAATFFKGKVYAPADKGNFQRSSVVERSAVNKPPSDNPNLSHSIPSRHSLVQQFSFRCSCVPKRPQFFCASISSSINWRRIFSPRRAASDRYRNDLTRACAELLVSGVNLQLQVIGQFRGNDCAANLCAPRLQFVDVDNVEMTQRISSGDARP